MIKQKLQDIKSGKLSAEKNIRNFVNKIKKEDGKINSILHLNEKAIEQAKNVDKRLKGGKVGKLAGLGFVVKSNINVEGLICNCASKTLENYRAGYNATVIEKLLAEDAIIIGMTNMDEFALGSSGESSAFGVTKNPRVLDRIAGGTSSGSAAAVAAEFCDFAIGSDTGGSIRNPSSHCGIIGLKPSYGVVSRYGLVDSAMSFDVIGPLASSVEDCEIVFNIIKGRDENDATSGEFKTVNKKIDNLKIGLLSIKADDKIWGLVRKQVELVTKKFGWKSEDLELEHLDLAIQTFYPIQYVEFFSGTRKFDGRKYGYNIEESCGEEVLRRILGGSEITKAEYAGKYYRRALKAREIIKREFQDAFKKYDILVLPTAPRLPHKFGEKISVEDMYNYDTTTVPANLAEIPGISIPCGKIENVPVGLQILAAKGNDNFLLKVGKEFERGDAS